MLPARTPDHAASEELLRAEIAELRARLEEAEETLRAIRSGEVEALVVETADGPQVFTLQGLDAESNRFRGEILAQVSDAVIAVDADQRVTYLNAAAERQYRVSASHALGRQLSEIYTRRWPHAETEAGMRTALREHGEWRGEIIHRTHDGREIAVEKSVTALRDASGAPAGYVGVFRDITERARADELLRKSEERYRRVIETAHEGIWTIDAEGRTTYVNQRIADLLGYAPAEIMGRVHTDFMWEEDRPKGEVDLEQRRQGLPQVCDQRYRRKDDSELWTAASCNAMFEPDGTFIGALGMFTDITERKRSAEALRESEARYRSLFENMLDGFAYCQMLSDAHGQPDDFVYLAVNDTFGKLTGLENVTGQRVTQLFPGIKELNPELFECYGRVASTGNAERFEMDFKPLGLRLSVSVSCPMKGYFVAVFDDITERSRVEEALRESEQRFRIMADSLPLIIWVHDAQGQLQFVNQTYCEFFDVTPEQVAGPNWQPLVHADDLAAYAREFSACVRDRRPFHAEVRARRFDGEWRWLESRAQPRFSASGEYLGMVGSSPDITERKHAEEQMTATNERLLISSLHQHELTETAGKVNAQLQAEMTERKQAEERIRQLNAGLEERVVERTAELEVEVAAHRLAEERVGQLNAQLNARVAELADTNAELESFSYTVSHDLRAPLRHVGGFVRLLAEGAEGRLDADTAQYLPRIADAATRMGQLIDALLDFSRLGRAGLHTAGVKLEKLIEEIRDHLQPDLEGRAIEWKIGPLPVVRADPAMLRQVLANLLENAVKFTRTQPAAVIEITCESGPAEHVVHIRDNGAGFDPRYADKLFGVFQRLHAAKDFEGTGIGLATSRRIIHRHGGRIGAESQPGQGAHFYFSLPRNCDTTALPP